MIFRRPRVCQTAKSGQACLAVMSSPQCQGGARRRSMKAAQTASQMNGYLHLNDYVMAESQGFEPWEALKPRRFSRPLQSTTLPTFLKTNCIRLIRSSSRSLRP